MASTPESKIKKKLVAQLKELGAYYFYPVTGGYGRSGVPDVVCCFKGMFFAFECKAGKNKPTVLQQMNIDEIRANKGIAVVINEDNVDTVYEILTESPSLDGTRSW